MDWLLIRQVWNFLLSPRLFTKNFQGQKEQKVQFYEGVVFHSRRKPVENRFEYEVRMAVINLDDPPTWFKNQSKDHFSADEARQMTGTAGNVKLLTHPSCLGYTQNPISVYYCYNSVQELKMCIAEVTNTPWGERVVFLFDPNGQRVPKCLHVSPFMDMNAEWILKASDPGETLSLQVLVDHKQMGRYFDASLVAKRSSNSQTNENAGLFTFLRYGYEPFRVAFWIYWQAIILVRKGATFFNPPDKAYYSKLNGLVTSNGQTSRPARTMKGQFFQWRQPKGYPWNV
eukprot:TRINITY_DN10644_c0_g1_i1.p1 TRINITY_DN10644_c0_g1~~TRINITY_DN10644_c0_g1_i1.p1  ORF type:complete len:286 (+),score=16.48 TRINITY_DN10644_c0_g1_i1:70-927(+)